MSDYETQTKVYIHETKKINKLKQINLFCPSEMFLSFIIGKAVKGKHRI